MMNFRTLRTLMLFCLLPVISACNTTGEGIMVVDGGGDAAPIILTEEPLQSNAEAADDLAHYIEKISGVRPEVMRGVPEPVPESALWVGYQGMLEELFPETDFRFEHAEEILLAAANGHAVIAGNDLVTGAGVQDSFGTANAVYTFLQEYLDVRWLWPGELGEDIIEQKTIALEPFEYRFQPPLRERRMRYGRVAGSAQADQWWEVYQRGRP